MFYTHENKGTSYYFGDRQVKNYHQPSGALKIEIFENSIYRNLDKIMNDRRKLRHKSLGDGIYDTDIKY